MRLTSIFILVFLSYGCGIFKKDNPVEDNPNPSKMLDEKADLYCDLAQKSASSYGWVGTECDQLLFNSLRSLGCPLQKNEINILQAEQSPGYWRRDAEHKCFPEGSKSTISKDMLTGLLLWIWAQGSAGLPVIERLIAYGESHDWYMGEAVNIIERESRVKITGGLKATFYELRFRLGGADSDKRNAIQTFDKTNSGFEAHIGMLHLLLRGVMIGAIDDIELDYAKTLAKNNTRNQLFRAIKAKFDDGDQEYPMTVLNADTALFPNGKLPTNSGRCNEPYIWQEASDSSDWNPCPEQERTFDGTDLVFARAVINNLLPVTKINSSDSFPKLTGKVHVYNGGSSGK